VLISVVRVGYGLIDWCFVLLHYLRNIYTNNVTLITNTRNCSASTLINSHVSCLRITKFSNLYLGVSYSNDFHMFQVISVEVTCMILQCFVSATSAFFGN